MSNAHTFIEDFNPFTDDVADFLLRCRNEYNEHYGKWMQTSYLDTEDPYIEVDIRTGGWSENEDMVVAMLRNTYISAMFYYSWKRGGQHVFHFTPDLASMWNAALSNK